MTLSCYAQNDNIGFKFLILRFHFIGQDDWVIHDKVNVTMPVCSAAECSISIRGEKIIATSNNVSFCRRDRQTNFQLIMIP